MVYSVCSKRLLIERPSYDVLFRGFVELNVDGPVWDYSTFSFNRHWMFHLALSDYVSRAARLPGQFRDNGEVMLCDTR